MWLCNAGCGGDLPVCRCCLVACLLSGAAAVGSGLETLAPSADSLLPGKDVTSSGVQKHRQHESNCWLCCASPGIANGTSCLCLASGGAAFVSHVPELAVVVIHPLTKFFRSAKANCEHFAQDLQCATDNLQAVSRAYHPTHPRTPNTLAAGPFLLLLTIPTVCTSEACAYSLLPSHSCCWQNCVLDTLCLRCCFNPTKFVQTLGLCSIQRLTSQGPVCLSDGQRILPSRQLGSIQAEGIWKASGAAQNAGAPADDDSRALEQKASVLQF